MNTKELTGKFQGCFDAPESLERELVLKQEETGKVLVRAVLRHLDANELGECLTPDRKIDAKAIILKGVKELFAVDGEGDLKQIEVTEESVGKLSKSRFVGGVLRAGVFDALATELTGMNVLGEGEAKNS